MTIQKTKGKKRRRKRVQRNFKPLSAMLFFAMNRAKNGNQLAKNFPKNNGLPESVDLDS
jgi:hypothetical protein